MKFGKWEIVITNKFVYYYADFLRRIYGLVIRHLTPKGEDIRYVGHLPPPPSAVKRPKILHGEGYISIIKERGSIKVSPGDLVIFRSGKHLQVGCCLSIDIRSGKVAVSAPGLGEVELPPGRITFSLKCGQTPKMAVEDFLDSSGELSEKIDLSEVWSLFKDRSEGLHFRDIAELYWGRKVSDLECAAMLFHVDKNSPYFKFHEERCLPLSGDEVRSNLSRVESEIREREKEEQLIDLLMGDKPLRREKLTEAQNSMLGYIADYALWGKESLHSGDAESLLGRLGYHPHGGLRRVALDLLIRKGIWDKDQYLELLREEWPIEFGEAALREADMLEVTEALEGGYRRNLSDVEVISIEEDDYGFAISLKENIVGYHLGIHIPDVAAFVTRGSALDEAASDRMMSLLLPEGDIPMLPERLRDEICRFAVGKARPALSFFFDLNSSLSLYHLAIVPSVVNTSYRFTPDQVDDFISSGEHPVGDILGKLYTVAEHLRGKRVDNGGVLLKRPDIKIKVDAFKEIHIEGCPFDSKSGIMMEELSILANSCVANFCAENHIPVIYRMQDPVALEFEESSNLLVRRYRMLRGAAPWKFSVEPGRHHMLGVDMYCQVTSPLRRYTDLVSLRQIANYLNSGGLLYGKEELRKLTYLAEEWLSKGGKLEQGRKRYWLLKYLSGFKGRDFEAAVLDRFGQDVLVELADYPLRFVFRPRHRVKLGDTVQLTLQGIDVHRGMPYFAEAL